MWIWLQPEAVPSLPSVILLHHFCTFVLLLFPLRYPQLAAYTCWDGLVELNTLCLIARRQLRWGAARSAFGFAYWASFFPLRMGLYPYLLYRFYVAMLVRRGGRAGHAAGLRGAGACGCWACSMHLPKPACVLRTARLANSPACPWCSPL